MASMTRGQFVQLLTVGLHKIFNQFEDTLMRDPDYDMIFNKEDSVSAFEDEIEMAGTGPMVEKPEGNSIFYDTLIQGGTKRFVMFTYALGLRASYELVNDDKYGFIKKGPMSLIRSGKFTKAITIWSVVNNGFTTTLTSDGLSLFNNEHALLGGTAATNVGPGVTNVIGVAGTYPNRPSTDVDLSLTALQLMTNQFNRLIDAQGIPIAYKPKVMVSGPELVMIWRELLGSAAKPYTADNEVNAILGENLTFMVTPYISSQSAWFGFCDKQYHTMKYIERESFFDDYDDDFDNRAVKQVVIGRWGQGVLSWLGTWGSNGP